MFGVERDQESARHAHSDALQIVAVLADVLDGHDVRGVVSAAWSLLGNRLGAQAGMPTPTLSRQPPPATGRTAPPPGPTADALRRCHPASGSLPLGDRAPWRACSCLAMTVQLLCW